MKKTMITSVLLLIGFMTISQDRKTVLMDLNHGQRFWNDPENPVPDTGWDDKDRIQYLNSELSETLGSLDADLAFARETISYKAIKDGKAVVLHAPSKTYSEGEIGAVQKYLKKGGSLLLVMEADYWTDLVSTNVNEIIAPYSIQYGQQSPDTLAGGYTTSGLITSEKLKVTYQLGRSVEGGTPFAFNSQDGQPFGVYKELESGGKLIVLGDAMSTMYMTEWRGVDDYQCHAYMKAIFTWLLEE